MFSKELKRIVSIILIISMVMTGNSSFTLASSVENVVKEDETRSSEPKNYYEMSYYEEHYEEIVSIKNLDDGDGSENDDSQNLIEEESDGARIARPYDGESEPKARAKL